MTSTRLRRLGLATVVALSQAQALAWGAPQPAEPPPPPKDRYYLGQATTDSLLTTAGLSLLGATVMTLSQLGKDKPPFEPSQVFVGFAIGGSLGAMVSGTVTALGDPDPPWISTLTSALVSGLVASGGLIGSYSLYDGKRAEHEIPFALVSLITPIVASLAGTLTYHGIRHLERPAPAPTPMPLETPWPTPSPPVRLWLYPPAVPQP